jgi:hypothetical protein
MAIAGLVACSGGEPTGNGPPGSSLQPGPVTATLVSPAGDEGAAVFDLLGDVDNVSVSTGRLFTARIGDTTRVAVVRSDAGPIQFRFVLRTGGAPLSARVVEVAAPDNSLRTVGSAYRVTLVNDASGP